MDNRQKNCIFAHSCRLISPVIIRKIMGRYINKGNNAFRDIVNSEYVDKTSLIPLVNATLNTESRYSCVTRCRRFGKSMAAKMLCAYYDKSCDSRELFRGLVAEKDGSFEKYLNKYYVISVDMTDFTTKFRGERDIVKRIQNRIIKDVLNAFPQINTEEDDDLMDILYSISESTGDRFVMIIDEWDAILPKNLLAATISGNEQAVVRAIDQIKRKEYPEKLAEYTGDILLVGINYDKETKLHTCKIERMG